MSIRRRMPAGAHHSLHWILLTASFVIAPAPSPSQETGQPQNRPDIPAAPVATTSPLPAASYAFPDGKQQFRNYIETTFGPLAFVRSAVGARLDQIKPAPPEWDTGAEGFGERYGFRLGMGMMTDTIKYSAGALLHEDVTYYKCACAGFFPRTAHVLVSPFVAKARSGQTTLSFVMIGAPYAGSFAAVNAWYPSRYEPEDAARLGTFHFAMTMGVNLVREFVLRKR